jgi:hypothetical protein
MLTPVSRVVIETVVARLVLSKETDSGANTESQLRWDGKGMLVVKWSKGWSLCA